MAYNDPTVSIEAAMASIPQNSPQRSVQDTFVADRAMFWARFTGFTKYAVIAVVVLLLAMWVFLV